MNHTNQLPKPESIPQLNCPLCGGFWVRIQGSFRCQRCSFMLCEGCDTSSSCDFILSTEIYSNPSDPFN